MHLPHQGLPLAALTVLWLSWAVPSAQWAWGPYNDDWKKHIRSNNDKPAPSMEVQPPPLMYRVAVLPRNDSSSPGVLLGGGSNGTSHYYGWTNATTDDTGSNNTTTAGVLPPSLNGTSVSWNSSSSISISNPSNITASNITNTTTTTTPLDTTCGVQSPLFALQVQSSTPGNTSSEASTPFDGWWLRVSGNTVLFTSQQAKATAFGVNSGGGAGSTTTTTEGHHLCVPPRAGGGGRATKPLIAVVETRLASSPLYFLDPDYAEGFQPEYEPLVCGGGGGSELACARADLTGWAACGMQLEIGSGRDGATEGGLNCSSVTLNVFKL